MSLRAHRAWQSPEIASSSHKVGFLAMIFSGFSLSNNNKGIALLIVIAISGVVSLIIGVMMSQYIIHTHSIRSSIDKVQAFYTAEAGIKKAIYYLTEDETKGIDYRTGDLIADMPIQEEVFYEKDDQAEISIIDDCGLVRIKSRAKGRFPKTIEVVVTGVVPEDLRSNLHMVSSKPLVLATGGKLKGLIKLNQDPVYQGGSIDGVLETNASLPYPGIFNLTFTNAISYFRYLLSSPNEFGAELFSSQVFSPDKPFPTNKVFVNDMILIENRPSDTLWHAGNDLMIASTARIQISGLTKLSNATITAIGPITILDKSEVRSSKIYSETSIEIRENAIFSGVLIAPAIRISERAQILNPTTIYCGAPFKYGAMMFNNELPAYCTIINLCSGKGSLIEISESAKIEGFIYSNAFIKHHGEISGFVYCRSFYDEPVTQDTTNRNVLSGTIQPAQSIEPFYLPVVFQEIKDFKIIKWQEF